MLSDRTKKVIDRLFSEDKRSRALAQLESYDEWYQKESQFNKETSDRLCFAICKIAKGDLKKLEDAIKLAREDYRDLLMAADFGFTVTAHEEWYRDLSAE